MGYLLRVTDRLWRSKISDRQLRALLACVLLIGFATKSTKMLMLVQHLLYWF